MALLSIAIIPRAHLMNGHSLQPVETIPTKYSRWGSPAQPRKTTFAGRAVTSRGLDAQPAPTQPTSDVQNPTNAFFQVYNVMVIHNVYLQKMKFLMNVSHSI